jgi:uncharacterized protein (TIGR03437 family)
MSNLNKQGAAATAARLTSTSPMLKFCVCLWLLCLSSSVSAQIPPISSGYGANGTFTVTDDKFPSPLFTLENVHVFRPAEAQSPVPVIFFAPGFSVTDPVNYRPLINHIVSRGFAVVFSPFQIIAGDGSVYEKRYDTIWAGNEEAVRRFGASFDLTRVAFIGHSFGGGASFAMMQRGAVGQGWGSNGLFLFVMAPWYVYEITASQLVQFPAHAKLLVQVYESDNICDHRIAKEVYERANLPASEKDFVLLRNDANQGVTLEASHGTPSGQTANGLDYYGIWRLFDALADYAFYQNPAGQPLALGKGSAVQRYMGEWPAVNNQPARPVNEALAGDCVPITRASSSFLFPYDQTIHGLSTVSAASFRGSIAADSVAATFGKLLSASFAINEAATLPVKLNGTTLKVRDSACVERPAPLFFVSPAQINFLVPSGTASGAATVLAYNEAGAVSLGTVNVSAVAPSLFSANATGQGVPAALALRVKADGSQAYEEISRYDNALKQFVAVPLDLGQANEQVFLILFGTGWRGRSRLNNVSVTLGGTNAEPLFAGAQGSLAGLDQLNLKLPSELSGRGEVDLVLRVEGQQANTVRLSFK